MSNIMKFEFDFDEVLEGIKQGVIRELSEIDTQAVLSDVKSELKRDFGMTWEDKHKVKTEINEYIKEGVLQSIKDDIIQQNKKEMKQVIDDIVADRDEYLTIIRAEIISDTTNELVSSLRREIQSKVNQEVQGIVFKMFNNVGLNNIKVADTGITITEEEYKKLQDKEIFLEALEQEGVDNWEGYSYAWNRAEELKNEDE